MEVVAGYAVVLLYRDVSIDRLGLAKQNQGLVDQVRTQVQQHAAPWLFSPAITNLGAETVEVAFILGDLAQVIPIDQGLECQEVAVPTAVLKDRDRTVDLAGVDGDGARLIKGHGEGLVDDHVLAGGEGRMGLAGVQGVGRGNDHQVDLRISQGPDQIGGDDRDFREVGPHLGRVAGDHRVQLQTRRRGDQRRMEGLAGIAIADQGDLERRG